MPGYIPFYIPKEQDTVPSSPKSNNVERVETSRISDGSGIERYLLPNGLCVEMDCYPNCEFPRC